MAGHSLGELTALCLAGVYSLEDGFRIVNKRALCMDKAASMNVDPGVMAAVDVPLDLLQKLIQGREDVHIGNINSPNQVVLSGHTGGVKDLCKKIKEMGHRATLLRVSMAFHSPIMKVIHDELEAFVAAIPFHSPRIPVISNTTMAPYPSDPGEIRRILMTHLESPVHWIDNVRTLWNDFGVRLFVEVGPGETLSNLIADTLPEPACIQTCLPSEEVPAFKSALARLYVQGHLKVRGEPKFFRLPAQGTPLDSASAMPGKESSAGVEAPGFQALMERLIQIIMDTTGFEKDEIKPEMDLRKDLSIRSSRLPIIMDAAERQFGITIELEDFINTRTVLDIAQRISGVIARQQGGGLAPAADPGPAREEAPRPPEDEERVKRLVFSRVPIDLPVSPPMKLSPGEPVLILSPGGDDAIAARAGDFFRRDCGVDTISMQYLGGDLGPGAVGHDILTDEGSRAASGRIAAMAAPAGLIIILPQGGAGKIGGMADLPRLLRGFLLPLKAFLESPAKKFVVLIHFRDHADPLGHLLAEGMLGLFLSTAQEYSSVQFRTLEIGGDTDLRTALRGALGRGCATVEIVHRDGGVFTSEAHIAPSVLGDELGMILSPGDVVVMSGGATGISAHLARSLAPFIPRLVFLGENRSGFKRRSGGRRVPGIRLPRRAFPIQGARRSPGRWPICIPRGLRPRTILAM